MNTIFVSKHYFPNGKLDYKLINFSGVGSINYVLSVINVKYVSYYLKKLEEVMSGEKEKVKIYITDDVNYDAPEDYLTVRKELVTYREEAGGEYVETEELYEFLKVMKAELGLSDEVVV